MPCTVIRNCWVSSKLLSVFRYSEEREGAILAVRGKENKSREVISHISNDPGWISITAFLNGDDVVVAEDISEDPLALSAVTDLNTSTHIVSEDEGEGSRSRTVLIGIQTKSIRSAIRTIEM